MQGRGAQPQTQKGVVYEPNKSIFATTRGPPLQQLILFDPLFKRFSC